MHYKNGKLAQDGDFVIFHDDYIKKIKAGSIHSIIPGSTTCNCQVSVVIPGGVSHICKTLGEMYHAEDAYQVLELQKAQVKQDGG